ncbi:Hsp70 family protein [Desulfobacterales bacterium HSG17]|nr:Hsp70 family protein [Desulfobacterales bacterium HSG17]
MGISVGIDLGTTNSACCALINGKFKFLKFRGKELLPSAILWQDGKLTVGEKARKKSVIYSDNFIKSSKTFMGNFKKKWTIEDRNFSTTDVASEILSHIKKAAEKYFETNQKITSVITVPAYFTANQINETKIAGENAGFIVKQIITEPVAAAIAYGFEDQINQKIFVVDIGGGTFDVSILEIDGNKYQTLAIEGDNKLGGDNFDEVILEMCFKKIRQTAGLDLSSMEKTALPKNDFLQARQRLIIESEIKKIELSEVENVEIEIPNLFNYKEKPYNFSLSLSRDEFQEEAKYLLNKIRRTIKKCIDDVSISSSDIDKVILVGGTSYMPIIQNYIKELFGQKPYSDMDLSKLVAMGAALVADNENDTIKVRDIISHSLGIEIIGKEFARILYKNDNYPISKSEIFTTTVDYQENIDVRVFEGEDEKFVDNNEFYGNFILNEIERARAGSPQIEVSFMFDRSRDLHVIAKDLRTGSKKSKTIKIDKNM